MITQIYYAHTSRVKAQATCMIGLNKLSLTARYKKLIKYKVYMTIPTSFIVPAFSINFFGWGILWEARRFTSIRLCHEKLQITKERREYKHIYQKEPH